MGIELCISVRSGRADGTIKKRGDIICAKLENSPWGSEELKNQAIVRLPDSTISGISDTYLKSKILAIKAKLESLKANGEQHPVLVLPTAQKAEREVDRIDGTKRRESRMVQRSRIFVNFNLTNPQLTSDWLDKEKSVPVQTITANRVNQVVKYRGNAKIESDETLVNQEDQF